MNPNSLQRIHNYLRDQNKTLVNLLDHLINLNEAQTYRKVQQMLGCTSLHCLGSINYDPNWANSIPNPAHIGCPIPDPFRSILTGPVSPKGKDNIPSNMERQVSRASNDGYWQLSENKIPIP